MLIVKFIDSSERHVPRFFAKLCKFLETRDRSLLGSGEVEMDLSSQVLFGGRLKNLRNSCSLKGHLFILVCLSRQTNWWAQSFVTRKRDEEQQNLNRRPRLTFPGVTSAVRKMLRGLGPSYCRISLASVLSSQRHNIVNELRWNAWSASSTAGHFDEHCDCYASYTESVNVVCVQKLARKLL